MSDTRYIPGDHDCTPKHGGLRTPLRRRRDALGPDGTRGKPPAVIDARKDVVYVRVHVNVRVDSDC